MRFEKAIWMGYKSKTMFELVYLLNQVLTPPAGIAVIDRLYHVLRTHFLRLLPRQITSIFSLALDVYLPKTSSLGSNYSTRRYDSYDTGLDKTNK